MDSAQALSQLSAARVATLATVQTDGSPHVVPFVFALEGDTLYSAVDHKPKRAARLRRIRNIESDPRVSVLAHWYDDDWSQLWWVRVDGIANIVETGDIWSRAIEVLAAKYPQYRGQPPTGAVITIEIRHIAAWSATD